MPKAVSISAMLACSAAWCAAASPHADLRSRRVEYAGPRGLSAAVQRLGVARIAYFGPSNPADPLYGGMWRAARLAVEEANGRPGRRLRFELTPAWSENPWGTGVARLARLAYDPVTAAIVGGVDGPTTHLAEQVAVKARLPLVSPVSFDGTVHDINIPWIFSLTPDHRAIADCLARPLGEAAGRQGSWVLLSADDHDSRLLAEALAAVLGRRGLGPRYYHVLRRGAPPPEVLVNDVVRRQPAAIAVAADVGDTAAAVAALRRRGYSGLLVLGPAAARARFLELAGADAAGAVRPVLASPDRPAGLADYAELHTYDALRLLVRAVDAAGPDRAAVAEALRRPLLPRGASGPIRLDGRGANRRLVRLAEIRLEQTHAPTGS